MITKNKIFKLYKLYIMNNYIYLVLIIFINLEIFILKRENNIRNFYKLNL